MIVDGYIRVSQVNEREGESFISPLVQRETIERWAWLHSATVGELFEELDQSGARADRPLLERALARVESGDSSGIVVSRLDRFGRSLLDGLAAIDRITQAGGTFVAVEDGLDLSTDTGRLVLRIMLSLGEWELDRVRSNWRTAKQRAIARGVHIGLAPAGYRRRRDGRLAPDPIYAPVITELFRRRADGARIGDLCRFLNDRQLRTMFGAPQWTWTTVDGLLRNRRYLGELHHGAYLNPSAHAPLVDPATWQAAQRPLDQRPARRTGDVTLLRGLLRCTGCRRIMTSYRIRRGTARENRIYICQRRSSLGPCPAPVAIQDSLVEPCLEAIFWQELERWPRSQSTRKVHMLEARAKRLESELIGYRDSERVARTLGTEHFEDGLAIRRGRLERALLAVAAARRELADPGLPDAGELRARWAELSLHERRDAIARLIDCAFVFPRPGPVEERLVVCPRGRAPDDLPPSGPRRFRSLRPFDPDECSGSVRLTGSGFRRWPQTKVQAALDPFLAGRGSWPSFLEFQAAGLGLVYRQVEVSGGPAHWARRFGLRWEKLSDRFAAWSDTRIRHELEEFLAGRSDWPTQDEFDASGRATLRRALNHFGGHERWADEFGLDLPRRRRRLNTWTDERIETELRRLIGGSKRWPTKREFEQVGLVSLYHAIMTRGTRPYWADRLGVPVPRNRATVPLRWSDAAIDGALRDLLEGRDAWPIAKEFADAGLWGLYQVIGRSPGGHERWARRYGVPRPTTRRAEAARQAHARRRARPRTPA